MTRRPRRASSAPQRVGSDEGLTSARPTPLAEGDDDVAAADRRPASGEGLGEHLDAVEAPPSSGPAPVEQTRDDTDEGWGERGEGDASARWLRENRPPHWS